jgi:hypothetical protein
MRGKWGGSEAACRAFASWTFARVEASAEAVPVGLTGQDR